jgi:hypothetical protein
MLSIVEAAYALRDASIAAEAYELVAPYAALPVMPSLAVACFGSVERMLGLAAATTGRHDDAIGHLERAVDVNARLGNLPLTAITRADLAVTLCCRGAPGDHARALVLLDRAIEDGDGIGMTVRVAAWQQRRQDHDARVPARDHAGDDADVGVFQRAGSHWTVRLRAHEVMVADGVGMDYLRRLLAQPGVAFSAAALAGGGVEMSDTSRQPLIDEQARAAYRARAVDLTEELAQAEAFADIERVAKLRVELDTLVDEIEHSRALAGKDRMFAGATERARTSVRKAIKRAIDRIVKEDAVLGALLDEAVTTGATCAYAPTPACPDHWVTD